MQNHKLMLTAIYSLKLFGKYRVDPPLDAQRSNDVTIYDKGVKKNG